MLCLPTGLAGFGENGNRHFLRLEKGAGSTEIRSISLIWLPGKSQAYSEIPLHIHCSMKLGKFLGRLRLVATAVEPVIKVIWQILCSRRLLGCIIYKYICSYGKFWEKRWHLIPGRSSSCVNLSGLMSLWLCLGYPDDSAQLCSLSVLQGYRNGERKIKGCVAHVLCVLVTYPSQLQGLKEEGSKQVKSLLLTGSQHVFEW